MLIVVRTLPLVFVGGRTNITESAMGLWEVSGLGPVQFVAAPKSPEPAHFVQTGTMGALDCFQTRSRSEGHQISLSCFRFYFAFLAEPWSICKRLREGVDGRGTSLRRTWSPEAAKLHRNRNSAPDKYTFFLAAVPCLFTPPKPFPNAALSTCADPWRWRCLVGSGREELGGLAHGT